MSDRYRLEGASVLDCTDQKVWIPLNQTEVCERLNAYCRETERLDQEILEERRKKVEAQAAVAELNTKLAEAESDAEDAAQQQEDEFRRRDLLSAYESILVLLYREGKL